MVAFSLEKQSCFPPWENPMLKDSGQLLQVKPKKKKKFMF